MILNETSEVESLRIIQWNIRGIYKNGSLLKKELELKRHKVALVQEGQTTYKRAYAKPNLHD